MKRALLCLVMLVCVLGFVVAGGQQGGESAEETEPDYPTRPVTIICPWDAGGGTDMLARGLLTVMGNYFPRPMVVVNRPGGGGTIGTTEALNAKPDGYTILITGWGPFVTQPFLMDVPYGDEDYEVVLQLSRYPRILCAKKDAPYDDIKEMMEYAKANPEKVVVGIASVGTTGHLAMAQLESEYGVKFTTVPQGGGGPQKVAVLGGHVDVAPLTASEGGPLVTSGQLKALAIMDSQRFPDIPDIKTGAELGYPIESGVATHLFVPAGTPAGVKKMLHDAFKNCLEDEAFKTVAVKLNLGAQYADAEFAEEDIAKFRKIYEKISAELGLKK